MQAITIFGAVAMALVLNVAASASAAPPTLPSGHLQLMSGSTHVGWFIDLDETTGKNGVFEATLLGVYTEPSIVAGKPLGYILQKGELRCAERTWQLLASSGFTPDGELFVQLPPDLQMPIRPNQMQDYLARVKCDGVQLAPRNIVMGYKGAHEAMVVAQRAAHP